MQTWMQAGGEFVVPVDPVYIAERMGVKVFTAEMDDDVSGMLIKDANRDPEIYINDGDSSVRRRFTLAHELGHFHLRQSDPEASREWSYVDRRDMMAAQGTAPHEIFANQFAAELLMPREEVAARRALGIEAPIIALEFEVSGTAMGYRVQNLGL